MRESRNLTTSGIRLNFFTFTFLIQDVRDVVLFRSVNFCKGDRLYLQQLQLSPKAHQAPQG